MLLAHGRNRPAEADFLKAAAAPAGPFSVETLPDDELDPVRSSLLPACVCNVALTRARARQVYQCMDVSVLRLRVHPAAADAAAAAATT